MMHAGLFTLGAFALSFVLALIFSNRQPTLATPPPLEITHVHNGPLSMCNECIQPGDTVHIVTHGPSSMRRAIFVYRNEVHEESVINADELVLSVEFVGAYTVVAVQLLRESTCVFGMGGYDNDVVAMKRCGGETTVVNFDVR